jgi:DNA-directed RNA polymerase subunit RPC12/RpoP
MGICPKCGKYFEELIENSDEDEENNSKVVKKKERMVCPDCGFIPANGP